MASYLVFMPLTPSLIFHAAGTEHNHRWSEGSHAVEAMKRARQCLTKGMRLHKRSWGNTSLWPIPILTDQFLSAYLIVLKLISLKQKNQDRYTYQ